MNRPLAEILNDVCSNLRPPICYWSDNGGENVGAITQNVLRNFNINHIKTLPGNPQSNGKIERWWQRVDSRTKNLQSWEEMAYEIDKFTYIYNTELPHGELPLLNGFHATPEEIFHHPDYQIDKVEDINIYIDGNPVKLLDFIK